MPEDHAHHAPLTPASAGVQSEPPRPKTVRARHAASLLVYRLNGDEPDVLMGMRGHRHRFMPNKLVFPGGAVDRADLSAPCATPLSPHTERALRKKANQHLVHGLGVAAARELLEETGLTLGVPPRLDALVYLARAVTPSNSPIRYNARFLAVPVERVSGELGGDGELDNLRFYGMQEALALDLMQPTRHVLERLHIWLTMSEAERLAETHFPAMVRNLGWSME